MVTEVNLRLAFRSKKRTLKVNDPVRRSDGRVRYPYRIADPRNSGGYVLSCFASFNGFCLYFNVVNSLRTQMDR